MKTLRSIMMGLALLIACGIANATPNKNTQKTQTAPVSKSDAIEIYTNAVIHGKLNGLDNLLANGIEFNVYNGEKLFKLDKATALESFKASENIEQDCKYTTTTVEDNERYTTIKLEMKYNSYVRTSLITFSPKKGDWKVTKVETHS